MTTSRDGRPEPGEKVVLTALPPGFLDDLPREDQQALTEVIGKAILLNEYDEDGRAELEFTAEDGRIHFVWVSPEFIRPAK
jgi:hypothetical protein